MKLAPAVTGLLAPAHLGDYIALKATKLAKVCVYIVWDMQMLNMIKKLLLNENKICCNATGHTHHVLGLGRFLHGMIPSFTADPSVPTARYLIEGPPHRSMRRHVDGFHVGHPPYGCEKELGLCFSRNNLTSSFSRPRTFTGDRRSRRPGDKDTALHMTNAECTSSMNNGLHALWEKETQSATGQLLKLTLWNVIRRLAANDGVRRLADMDDDVRNNLSASVQQWFAITVATDDGSADCCWNLKPPAAYVGLCGTYHVKPVRFATCAVCKDADMRARSLFAELVAMCTIVGLTGTTPALRALCRS